MQNAAPAPSTTSGGRGGVGGGIQAFSPDVQRKLEFEKSISRSPIQQRDFSNGRRSMSPTHPQLMAVQEPAIMSGPSLSYSMTVDNTTAAINNNFEMGKQISEQRMFEWGFGRNLRGELSLGVTKNALVPACTVGLTEV